MTYQVTETQILRLNSGLGSQAALIAQAINDAAAKYSIDQQPRRLRYFVAQTLFESQNYTVWSENLTYSTAARLVQVWPSRFTLDTNPTNGKANANLYVNNPSGLANLVYANRNGNGDVSTGDGYTFRGRGAIQLTGRSNYTAYSMGNYGDLRIVSNPSVVAAPVDAFMSAAWFWSSRALNGLADTDSFTAVTQIINGSTATVPQRLQTLNLVNSVLQWTT